MLDSFMAAVRNELQARGYWLEADAPEVLVELGVSSEEIDRSGKNVTLGGVFSLKATVPVRRGITLGAETFKVQSEQSLGEEAAQADLVRIAMPRAHRWIGGDALPADTALDAAIIHIKGAELDPSEDRRVLAGFIQAVQGTDGTLLIKEISRDDQVRSYKFRIVYVKGKFPPKRFLETVLTAHPELQLTLIP